MLIQDERPTLGINYVEASRREIKGSITIGSSPTSESNHSLFIQQDIHLGVGGVYWNCVGVTSLYMNLNNDDRVEHSHISLACIPLLHRRNGYLSLVAAPVFHSTILAKVTTC
jgi:hypothetical protein